MSASGARTVFSLAERFIPGLQVNDVQGPLTGPLRIGSLKLDNPERKIELRNLALEWEPRALWQRHLHIRSLKIGQLNLTSSTKQSDEPAQLPDSLALPLTLQIDRVQVAGGTVNWGALNLPPISVDSAWHGTSLLAMPLRTFAPHSLPAFPQLLTSAEGKVHSDPPFF